jgi:hypothetical protein
VPRDGINEQRGHNLVNPEIAGRDTRHTLGRCGWSKEKGAQARRRRSREA